MIKIPVKFLSIDEPRSYDFNDSNWKQIKWTSYKVNVLYWVKSVTFKTTELVHKQIQSANIPSLTDIYIECDLYIPTKWDAQIKMIWISK